MSAISFILAMVFLTATPQENLGTKYIENVIAKYDSVRDYIVDVKVHLDLQAVQAPDMEATVYYKEPDKIKIDSKGLFFMPKDVGVINPRRFDPDKYILDVLDTLTVDGDPAVRVSLTPKASERRERNIILTINKRHWLIVEISTAPYPGRQASARISYGEFDGFWMPVKVDVNLDVAKPEGDAGNFGSGHRRANELKGKVEVLYSNYRINTGLSDDIFKKKNED